MKLIQGDYSKIKKYFKDNIGDTYFEFELPYVDENCVFKEINRFNDESRMLTRFKNKYSGDVIVDITDWIDKPVNEYFEAFSYFVLDRMLEFSSSKVFLTCEKECTQEFLSAIEECFKDNIQVTDLGVRKKTLSNKRVIGFALDETPEKPKNELEEEKQNV